MSEVAGQVAGQVAAQAALVNIFRRFDANGDGRIARRDLLFVLQQIGQGAYGKDEADYLLNFADQNGDGSIPYEDFVDWVFRPDEESMPTRTQSLEAELAKTTEANANLELMVTEKDRLIKRLEEELAGSKVIIDKLTKDIQEFRVQSPETFQNQLDATVGRTLTNIMGRPGDPGDKLRGLSVHHLSTTFEQEIDRAGLTRENTIGEVAESVIVAKGKDLVCPRDGAMGAAYVDCFNGRDNCGHARVMISYTWGYQCSQIIDALTQYCRDKSRNPKRLYVWMCCFCINQHRVKKAECVPVEEFKAEFRARVEGIGNILVLMTPWDMPKNLTRVWCIFEIFVAVSNTDIEVDILMPPDQRETLHQVLCENVEGPDRVWKALERVQVEQATASVKRDKDCILKMIKEPEGPGYSELNRIVTKYLQTWVVDTAEDSLREIDEDMSLVLYANVGELLEKVGKKEHALRILVKAKVYHEATGTIKSEGGLELLTRLGAVYGQLGDRDNKLAILEQSRQLFPHGLVSLSYAKLLIATGYAKYENGDRDAALAIYTEVEHIYEQLDLIGKREHAKLLMNIGIVRLEQARQMKHNVEIKESDLASEYQESLQHAVQKAIQRALDVFRQAKEVHVKNDTLHSHSGCGILKFLGDALFLAGDFSEAMEEYRRSDSIQKMLGTENSNMRAALLDSMAMLEGELGNTARMFETFELAWDLRVKGGSAGSPGGSRLKKNILERSTCLCLEELTDVKMPSEGIQRCNGVLDRLGILSGSGIIVLYTRVALLLVTIGAKRDALRIFSDTRCALEKAERLETHEGAKVLLFMGRTKGELGDQEGKMQDLKQALDIFQKTDTMETSEGIEVLILLGWAKGEHNDQDGALTLYEEALGIGIRIGVENGHLLMNIGVARMRKGDLEGALTAFVQCKAIRQRMGSSTHAVLNYIGKLKAQQEKYDECFSAYSKATKSLKQTGNLNTPQHALVLTSIGMAKGKCGEKEEQLATLMQAQQIREKTGTMHTRAGKELATLISSLS